MRRKKSQLGRKITNRKVTNQKNTGKRKKSKQITRRDQTVHRKQDFPKKLKKILPTGRRKVGEVMTATESKRGNFFLIKTWERTKIPNGQTIWKQYCQYSKKNLR